MPSIKLPTAEEVHSTYGHSEAAMQMRVGGLVERIRALEEQVQRQDDHLAKNSRNSSKPPVSDGLQKPSPKRLRQASGKPSGGQVGDEGARLEQVAKADYTIVHPVTACQADLTNVTRTQPTTKGGGFLGVLKFSAFHENDYLAAVAAIVADGPATAVNTICIHC